MRKFTDYKPLSTDEQTRLFGMCMPQGLAWNSKGDPDSNLYKLMRSLSSAINLLEEKTYEMVTQWDVRMTTDLILEWEEAVGIPDECRSAAEGIETRRTDVLTKLRKIPIITVADYQNLAEAVTGVPAAQWDIRPGSQDFPGDPLYRFVLLVTSPTVTSGAFTYPLGSGTLPVTLVHDGVDEVTGTVSDTSTIASGSIATISGADQSEYNGDFQILVTGATTFIYEVVGTPVTPATGTITVNFPIDSSAVANLSANSQYLLTPGVAFSGYPLAGSFRTDILRCVFRKITPAEVALVFD